MTAVQPKPKMKLLIKSAWGSGDPTVGWPPLSAALARVVAKKISIHV
jgi:hypothetical protein